MTDARTQITTTRDHLRQRRRHIGSGEGWSFVYVFFSNGTPFDAPNRSETCPQH